MKYERSYQVASLCALLFHAFVVFLLVYHPQSERPALIAEIKQPMNRPTSEPEIVKAVSVNAQEVSAAIEQLKAERAQQAQAEAKRQKALAAEAEALRQRRVQEQRRLEALRAESARAAQKRKQEAIAEQKRLEAVKQQQAKEAQKLEALKKEQMLLQKQQQAEKERALEQARLEKERIDAANRARTAGVIDKYKALILSAISQQWILPDQVNTSLSSRFTIRLAPNGAVLDVQLTRSSGDPVLDRSAQAAIYKASPLPVPSEPDMFNLFREISLTVRPENVRG